MFTLCHISKSWQKSFRMINYSRENRKKVDGKKHRKEEKNMKILDFGQTNNYMQNKTDSESGRKQA